MDHLAILTKPFPRLVVLPPCVFALEHDTKANLGHELATWALPPRLLDVDHVKAIKLLLGML